jgi:flagellar basal body P-ring formation protein FlgA
MKPLHYIISIVVLCLAPVLCRPAHALEISFKERAEVSTDYITLGDIVSFDEASALTSSLATKVVSQSPEPGDNLIIDSISIKDQIMRKTSLSMYTQWTGSRAVKVFRPGQEILPKNLLSAIRLFLKENKHELPQAEVSFVPKSLPIPFMLPQGKLDIEVIPSNPAILKSTRFSLICRVDGKVEKNFSIQGELRALAPVVIAADSLRRGTILTPANTKKVVKDLTEHDEPCTDQRLILGKRLKRSVRAQAVINASDVEIPPMIKRGQLVKIIFYQGSLYLTATGIARTDGKLNQIIRVRNANSNKLIQGRVTAPGVVEVII